MTKSANTRQFSPRKGAFHPQQTDQPDGYTSVMTFSVGVGEVVPEGRRVPAALFRVSGLLGDAAAVDRVAERLADWLSQNAFHPDGELRERCPASVVYANDKSARITVTAAGKKAGFVGPSGRINGKTR